MTHPCKSVYINSCQICDVGFTLYVNFTQIVIFFFYYRRLFAVGRGLVMIRETHYN